MASKKRRWWSPAKPLSATQKRHRKNERYDQIWYPAYASLGRSISIAAPILIWFGTIIAVSFVAERLGVDLADALDRDSGWVNLGINAASIAIITFVVRKGPVAKRTERQSSEMSKMRGKLDLLQEQLKESQAEVLQLRADLNASLGNGEH